MVIYTRTNSSVSIYVNANKYLKYNDFLKTDGNNVTLVDILSFSIPLNWKKSKWAHVIRFVGTRYDNISSGTKWPILLVVSFNLFGVLCGSWCDSLLGWHVRESSYITGASAAILNRGRTKACIMHTLESTCGRLVIQNWLDQNYESWKIGSGKRVV